MLDTENVRLLIRYPNRPLFYNQNGLNDYKFYCFGGEPRFLYVSENLSDYKNFSMAFYDLEMKEMPFRRSDYKHMDIIPLIPDEFDKMIDMVKQISKGLDFLRVDMYYINGKVYFSECTFYPCDGYMKFEPEEYDEKIGKLLTITKNEHHRKRKPWLNNT